MTNTNLTPQERFELSLDAINNIASDMLQEPNMSLESVKFKLFFSLGCIADALEILNTTIKEKE